MNDVWMTLLPGAIRSLTCGGLLLLAGWLAMRCTRSMAWKQVIGAWTASAALLCWAGCWLPAWLPVLPQPDFATRVEVTYEQAQRPHEVIPLMFESQPEMPSVQLFQDDLLFPDATPVVAKDELDIELPTAPQAASWSWTWSAATSMAVLFVPACLFGVLVFAQLALVRLVLQSRPVVGRAFHVWRGLTSHLANAPRVLTNDRLSAPVCFGWLRPTIVLPTRLAEQASTAQLTWIYRHELDHLTRGDHRTTATLGLAQVVFFMLPWFWCLRRDLLRAQEHLADAAAVGTSQKEATDYAEFLVDLSGQTQFQCPLAALSVRATPSELFRRVNMLLSNSSHRPASRTLSRWLGAGLLSTAIAVSGLGFASAQGIPVTPPPLPPAPVVEGQPLAPLPPMLPPVLIPTEDKKIKELQTKLEKLVLDGQTEEAKKVVDEITKLKEKAKEVVERPVAPLMPPPLPRPPVIMRGDFIPPSGEPVVSKVRKQYEEQLKSFDDLVEKAKDADAKESLMKARDEYKKQMADTLKEADDKAKQMPGQFQNQLQFRNFEFNEDFQKQMEVQQKKLQEMMKNRNFQPFVMEGMPQFNLQELGVADPFLVRQPSPRFGVQTAKVPEALIEQLDLAKDTGLLVQDVVANSVAEKGGVKKNDLLLKFAGKDVPTDNTAFTALVNKQKAEEKFDVVVLRKGKQVKIEGLLIPETTRPKVNRDGVAWQVMQVQIQNDEVTINATGDGVIYKLSGTLVDGAFMPDSITVGEKKYDSLEKVPEADQPRVKSLMSRVGRSGK